MIKKGNLKYQYYGPDMPRVLFDLAADPSETINVIDSPQYKEAVLRFEKRSLELGFGHKKPIPG